MKRRERKITLGSVVSALLGLCCAIVLGGLFYGAMVYRLAGEDGGQQAAQAWVRDTPAPLAQGVSAAQLYPGALLVLDDAQLTAERAQDLSVGGTACRVITRVYDLGGERQAEAVSAYPAAYLARMAQDGYVPQLMTGFVLAGMDAVYAVSGGGCALYARDGECAYAIFMPADEQAAYALGAAAYLEERP